MMSKRKTRTRINHGCKECRVKHTKCVIDDSCGSCKRCMHVGRSCEWDSPIKFKAVTSITEKVDANKKRRFDFSYGPEQQWVKTTNPVTFHTSIIDEDTTIIDSGSTTTLQYKEPASQEPSPRSPQHSVAEGHLPSLTSASTFDRPRLPPLSSSVSTRSPLPPTINSGKVQRYYGAPETGLEQHRINSQSSLLAPTNARSPSSPFHPQALRSLHDSSPSIVAFPSMSESKVSSLYQSVSLWPKMTAKESKLLRHFVDNLSAWIDATDSQHHFGTEVVRRTAHYPVLLYSVLAYSSLHMSRMQGNDDLVAEEYHNRCLKIMIQTLGDEADALDENLLAAIVILRGYEEISESDPRTHMQGSTRLLNSSSKFASSGGLGEAACWITLRQEIYISLTSNQPIKTNLEHYGRSQALIREDHDAWANRIVLIFAKILSVIFQDNIELDWHGFKHEIELWYDSKPPTFTPIILPCTEPGKEPDVFPNVWMLDSAQVVGMQNYYMARIVLSTFDPRLPGTGFHSFRARKDTEDAILKDLRMVLGLAIHNDVVQSAIFQASHILSMCGFCLRKKREQDAAVDFLNLRSQWM